MYRSARFHLICAVALLLAVTATHPLAHDEAGISLRITEEFIPPGGIAQVKIELTEPKPISTGGGRFSFSNLRAFDGIALGSPASDTYGVAVVNGEDIDVTVVSTTASFGTGSDDYPLLTVAARVDPSMPLGVRLPVTADPAALRLFDPTGAVYPSEIKNGFVQTAKGLSIDDVSPGSANLPKGAVVTILGTGFTRRTEIKLNDTKLAETRFISPTRIDVVLARAARMHGLRIRAQNPDGRRIEYFSYQRTTRLSPSVMPVFQDAVPLLPNIASLRSTVGLPGTNRGLALQNIGSDAANVEVRLRSAGGALLASLNLSLPRNKYLVSEITELFQMSVPNGAFAEVRSSAPVQAMGITVDAAGTAMPVVPTGL
jgi:hypothetical protein